MDKLELLAEQYKNCCSENDALKNDLIQSECARKTAIESLHIYKVESEQRGFEIIALKAENARYREALEFYADLGEPSIYVPFLIERQDVYHAPVIEKDMGEIAREALKGSYESDS